MVITRTGRRFFDPGELEEAFLERVHQACLQAGLYSELNTDFIILDCELMPWSAKAQDLLRRQYAAVGAAVTTESTQLQEVLQQAIDRGQVLDEVLRVVNERAESADKFRAAYGHYCWNVDELSDYRLAPFNILAAAGQVFTDHDHQWHMNTLSRLAAQDDMIIATPHRIVDLAHGEQVQAATDWWLELTAQGGEGMVVKPLNFIESSDKNKKDYIQPAVKCRGPEYLRIIYGPDYLQPKNLKRLRKRGLGRKRSLAMREFALGIESLERFVAGEPLRRVHECVFGVLALESEPVDPRL